jgi:hypothetical protein
VLDFYYFLATEIEVNCACFTMDGVFFEVKKIRWCSADIINTTTEIKISFWGSFSKNEDETIVVYRAF